MQNLAVIHTQSFVLPGVMKTYEFQKLVVITSIHSYYYAIYLCAAVVELPTKSSLLPVVSFVREA